MFAFILHNRQYDTAARRVFFYLDGIPRKKGGGGCGLTNLVPRPDFHSYAVAMTEGTVQLVSMDPPPPPPTRLLKINTLSCNVNGVPRL